MVELRTRRRGSSRSVDDIHINTYNNNNEHTTYVLTAPSTLKRSFSSMRKQGRLESLLTWQSLAILFIVISLTGFSLNITVEILRNELTDYDTILLITFALLFVILAVPLTYFIVGWYRYGRQSYDSFAWSSYQPLRGGIHFVILQAAAWTIYGIILVMIGWVAITGAKKIASGVLATIGTAGVLAQLLILISLQFFVTASNDVTVNDITTNNELNKTAIDAINIRKSELSSFSSQPNSAPLSKHKHRPGSLDVLDSAVNKITSDSTRHLTDTAATNKACGKLLHSMPIILSVLSAIIAMAVESLELSTGATVSLRTVSICGLLVAVPMTHVLVATKYSIVSNHQLSTYQLCQPLSGGIRFISLQALGWLIWTIALSLSLFSIYLNNNNLNVRGMFTMSSIGGIVSQLFVLLSLRYFDNTISKQIHYANTTDIKQTITKQLIQSNDKLSDNEAEAAAAALLNASEQKHTTTIQYTTKQLYHTLLTINRHTIMEHIRDARSTCIVTAYFLSPIISLSLLASPVCLAYTLFKYGIYLPYALIPSITLVLLYGIQFRDSAHKTGEQTWAAFRYNDVMWSDFARYFRAHIIPHGKLNKSDQYIFCFSPHGIYPMSTVWSTRCPQWYEHYDIEVNVAGASVMFYVPIIRELVLWSGGIDVSRDSVQYALQHDKNVLLIPGGQREMRYSRSSKQRVVLVNRHKGFCKLAIQHGCKLVPIYSFGEHELMDNIHLPTIQSRTTRVLGYMFPMLPYGRFYSPLPNTVQLTFVVGEPIAVQQCDTPTQQQIDSLHTEYYHELTKLFYQYRAQAGYPELELVLQNH